MAKIPQGILGGIRGRVGNIVGAAWKGINYIRSMPLSVANPNTTAQQAQRGAFTQVVAVARLLLADLVATYWNPFARGMSGYNHFISVNIASFATAGLNTPADFSSARGILTGVLDLAGAAGEASTVVVVTWTDNSGQGDALATDEPLVVYYNETQDIWSFRTSAPDTRADETLSVGGSDPIENDVMHLWMFFTRPDISKISDSAYDTFVVAA